MTRTQAKKDAARSRIAAALEAVDPNLKVADLESIIHYSFANKSMGWEALQLPGNGFATPFMLNGNKRLAIVGDLAIDLILSEPWYESGKDEGECCSSPFFFKCLTRT